MHFRELLLGQGRIIGVVAGSSLDLLIGPMLNWPDWEWLFSTVREDPYYFPIIADSGSDKLFFHFDWPFAQR